MPTPSPTTPPQTHTHTYPTLITLTHTTPHPPGQEPRPYKLQTSLTLTLPCSYKSFTSTCKLQIKLIYNLPKHPALQITPSLHLHDPDTKSTKTLLVDEDTWDEVHKHLLDSADHCSLAIQAQSNKKPWSASDCGLESDLRETPRQGACQRLGHPTRHTWAKSQGKRYKSKHSKFDQRGLCTVRRREVEVQGGWAQRFGSLLGGWIW